MCKVLFLIQVIISQYGCDLMQAFLLIIHSRCSFFEICFQTLFCIPKFQVVVFVNNYFNVYPQLSVRRLDGSVLHYYWLKLKKDSYLLKITFCATKISYTRQTPVTVIPCSLHSIATPMHAEHATTYLQSENCFVLFSD